MATGDYRNVKALLHDPGLVRLLGADRTYAKLLADLSEDDFLLIDPSMKVPFFAEVRDYVGAAEKADRKAQWIVKRISNEDVLGASMGAICFFLDFYTHTLSAPTVITRIDGNLYKATRIISRAEQLTGANYTDIRQLKEQLVLDLVNRWIYGDEDRNPNNYLVRYNSRNDQLIIAIDFSNVDLLHPGPNHRYPEVVRLGARGKDALPHTAEGRALPRLRYGVLQPALRRVSEGGKEDAAGPVPYVPALPP